jgi:hypothetical protein
MALLRSIVVRGLRCMGLLELTPLKVCWVRFVSKEFVQCNGLKPCCVGASGMEGFIMLIIRRSIILDAVQRSVMGLYEEESVGSSCGVSIVIILPCFQMMGIKQWRVWSYICL